MRNIANNRPVGRSATLKNILAIALIALVALAPVPAASNRPVFWAFNAGLVSVLAIVYFTGILATGSSIRLRWSQAGLPLMLLLLVLTYLAVQVLPLPLWIDVSDYLGPVSGPTISLAPGATLLVALQFLTYGLVGLLTIQVCLDRARAIWVLYGLFYVVTLHAAYALLALTQLGDTLLILEKWAYEGDATGTFINRNSFATFLTFGFVIGLCLIVRKLDRIRPAGSGVGTMRGDADWPGIAIVAACSLVQFAALIATESRLGAASAVAGSATVLTVYLLRFDRRRGRSGFALGMLGLLIAAGLAIWLYGGGLVERLGTVQDSAGVRGALYAQVVGMISSRPLFGYGGGSFEIVFPHFHRLPVSPDLIWDKAHSTYLGLWSELGLIFGTIPMLIVAFAAVRLFVLARFRQHDWATPLAGLAVIVAAAVHSVADFSLEIEANAITFTAIVAVAMATPTRSQLQGYRGQGPAEMDRRLD